MELKASKESKETKGLKENKDLLEKMSMLHILKTWNNKSFPCNLNWLQPMPI